MTAVYTPLTTTDFASHAQVRPSNRTIPCAKCEKPVFESAVVTGPLQHDDLGAGGIENQWFRHRWLYCDHCNHIQHWLQAADADGNLFNSIYVGPGFIRNQKNIDQMLAEHPEARGVEQT